MRPQGSGERLELLAASRWCQTAAVNPSAVFFQVVLSMLLASFSGRATILTFEDFTGNNLSINAIANPFGTGQYGSRAASAINAGFQAGDGFTPNVVLAWSAGWQTYTGWPFANNLQTAAGGAAQADF